MLVIRLARTGRNKYPTYRIVAAESARAATGKFVAILGHYNPHTKELVIKKDDTLKHLGHGAQPSNTVIRLLQREKIELPGWVKLKTKQKPSKQEAPPAAEAKAETAGSQTDATAQPTAAPAEEPATEAAEPTEVAAEPVATTAEANAEAISDKVTQAAPEDTAAGEAAQAEAAAEVDDKVAEAIQDNQK
ncbi:MAG TPA: 30S ribosomal protein S16 [Candidatus Saccharimonadales bacterium]|nr:30S ribosomal protein S16 [Candidatus Saccharimonadales bacterium]